MRIVTNADDLGANPATNAAIFELMAERLVTSATLLANGPAVASACREASRFGQGSFGVHLNLTELRPLTRHADLQPLLNEAGEFNGDVRRIARLSRLHPAIHDEWCAQVERVLALGVKVSHLDSHHHVHTIPALLPVLKAVQRRLGIRKVRISKNVYTELDRPSGFILLKKRLFNAVLRNWYATRTTDEFTNLETFCEHRARLTTASRSLEIMLHPGGVQAAEETRRLRELAAQDAHFRSSLTSYHEV